MSTSEDDFLPLAISGRTFVAVNSGPARALWFSILLTSDSARILVDNESSPSAPAVELRAPELIRLLNDVFRRPLSPDPREASQASPKPSA